ncbi:PLASMODESMATA CALLOSE-BINDING PROTEIN 3 [Linum grandiflorum]
MEENPSNSDALAIEINHAFLCANTLCFLPSQACTWCVCKDMPDAVLQKALDYACGAGADCNPTRQNGQCFLPNTVRAHCSYAVNSYYQKKGQSQGSCDFSGAATLSTSDPSVTGCSYPSSGSGSNTASQGISNSPKTGGTSTTTTSVPNSSNNPYSSSNGGVGGTGTGTTGNGNGLGSSGPGGFTDLNDSAAAASLTSSLFTAAGCFFLLGSYLQLTVYC